MADTVKNNNIFHEYEKYSCPAIILDSGLNIVYKNPAARAINIKPRLGTNIEKYASDANMVKLCAAIKKDELRIFKLNADSTENRCVIQPDGKNITALIFYNALNFIKEDNPDKTGLIKKIEDIIYKYNKYRRHDGTLAETGAAKSFGSVPEKNKESKTMIRVNEHFIKHMINLIPRSDDKHKKYCDIGEFLKNYSETISYYIKSFGYKVEAKIEDKMFYYELNEGDLLLMNYILSAFAFKHSAFKKTDIRFFNVSDAETTGILRYEFKARDNFIKTRGEMFVEDYLSEVKNMEYLDLNLAALIAVNNKLKLRAYFDDDEANGKVYLDLMFGGKSPMLDNATEIRNYITPEDIEKQAEIEFAGIFGQGD